MAVPTFCPKCGHSRGWNGPTYHSGFKGVYYEIKAYLGYACRLCGYTHEEPCLDAAKAPVMK